MSESIQMTDAVSRLLKAENLLFICHKNPDGDTLGAAAALYWALQSLGKTAGVFCADPIHERYDYMGIELFHEQFEPGYIVAVDIAGKQLFGEKASPYVDRVDLCIDHHGSNTGFAEYLLLDDSAAATCEMIYDIILAMGVTIDKRMADCLYTGVSTDTGCFRFTNTTARSHRVASRLIDIGADISVLNELLFENKSKQRIAIEQVALSTLEYHFDGVCALICMTREQIEGIGVDDGDLEGITSIPRSIEGVLVGITMRQQVSGSFKISVRTKVGLDAVAIAVGLGGGGHKQAAGCEVIGGLEFAKDAVLAEVKRVLDEYLQKDERRNA
ncbi:bifunctional oligoribonuclease/PAP phosphatase NrnA [Ruminococcaceae bacterium OttesenSCG-928-I18]|nr:bifunctional oligoribonuclease/PAP phosphatase NrnA [Ruminococcaceae bacterium OttesenSCG-928-I18]